MFKRRKSAAQIAVRVLCVFLALILIITAGAAVLFWDELKIIFSIKQLDGVPNAYKMEINGSYHFDEFLSGGGAKSDSEVSAFLSSKISKGFYKQPVESGPTACSVISAKNDEGGHVFGRNYDWEASSAIIVKHKPDSGYASISTCDFQYITGDPELVPDNFAAKMLAAAALYVPLDGINEAGLCVADLQVNEGGTDTIDTEKPNLTITTAIRLILNKCATAEEAVNLLSQYDIFPSGGISHHLAISDSENNSLVLEFQNGTQTAVKANYVTNFSLLNKDTSAGGISSKMRYEYLSAVYEGLNGVLSAADVKKAMQAVAQSGSFSTQWSVVYSPEDKSVKYYFDGNFGKAFAFSFLNRQ